MNPLELPVTEVPDDADVVLVDVREPEEYVAGHLPGAINLPLGDLGQRWTEIPAHGDVYVVCASGNRSLHAAQSLRQAGVAATSLAGGTKAWLQAGRPVVQGRSPR